MLVSFSKASVALFAVDSLFFTVVTAGKVQCDGLLLPEVAAAYREEVKGMFVKSYEAYKKHAWGHDDLALRSQGFVDSRNGWGASVIDGMSTMDYFLEAVNFTSNIDFSRSKTLDTVSVFETTIRYLGGLLSAYELSGEKHHVLVTKAREVADKLTHAWVEDNDIPYGYLDFSTDSPRRGTANIAEAGTLLMEWGTLSKHTGDGKYWQLAEKSMRRIATNPSPLPGLAAQGIDPSSGSPVGGYVTSAYGNQTYLADYDDSGRIVHLSSHLACFHGGNWLLGGRMLNNQTIIDVALQLVYFCWNTYASTATGIGPEVFAFTSEAGSHTGRAPPSKVDQEFYKLHGFYVEDGAYILRPEVLESNFYAWRTTGDPKYIERAASALRSFQKYLPVQDAYAGIQDVNNPISSKFDHMESFWFAEVLKYLYLTFDDPARYSLDEYVLNTEAQPLKAPPPKATYGSATGLVLSPSPLPFIPVDAPTPTYSQGPMLESGILSSVANVLQMFLGPSLRFTGLYL
ncbi:hypothetical protein NP233_g3526 [Leucocoprinus birnbaumii]|uniref:alpha-1,2-Mannosidase n=1 Tax=Leucocoprinus birnbaumii TaxID=56174 RepID=A0AAD5VZ06_9AGAR|nr:hypothetical protein NP233_g3526 [Leucocoprinus birnbaumii]